MTNEEKALYLSQKYGAAKNKNREIAVYQSGIEMAEWKDEQFKKFLEFEKFECDSIAKTVYTYDMSEAFELEIKSKCIDSLINKIFKEKNNIFI